MKYRFFYLNPHTGLDTPKFDNRNIQDLTELDDEELERELDKEAGKEAKPPKKTPKEEENEDDEDDLELEEGDEKDEENDEEDNDEDEDLDNDDEKEEKEKRKLALQEEVDRRKAARESQRESLVQNARNKQLTDKIREASNLTVTDDEIKAEATKEGLDFDVLDNFQKSMLKRTILAERKFSTVSEVVVEEDRVNEWAGKVDTWLDTVENDDRFKRLKGHEAEFKNFSMKGTRRGSDFEDLARAFLFDLPVEKKKHKGSVLLRGGGGEAPKRKVLTEDDTVAMRKVSPGRLTDMMKRGKVKIDI
jgi:hypothetical protein